MTAFIVKFDIDPSEIPDKQRELENTLSQSSGYVSIAAWKRPSNPDLSPESVRVVNALVQSRARK